MKKRRLALLMTLILLATVIGGCGSSSGQSAGSSASQPSANTQTSDSTDAAAPAGEVYEVVIGHMLPESDEVHLGYVQFKEMLEERSGGRFKVEIFPNSSLGSSDDDYADMLNNNIIQFSTLGTYTLSNLNTALADFRIMDLPYMFRTDEDYYNFADSEYGQKMFREISDVLGNFYMPITYIRSWHCLTTTDKEVYTPADLKGMSICGQVTPAFQSTLKAWGAQQAAIAYTEIYTALQQGAAGGHLRPINLHVSNKWIEVQKNCTLVNQCAMFVGATMNLSWYNSLPDDLRQIVDESLQDLQTIMRDYGTNRQTTSVQEFKDAGLNVIEPTAAQMEEWISASKPVYDEYWPQLSQEVKDAAQEILGRGAIE